MAKLRSSGDLERVNPAPSYATAETPPQPPTKAMISAKRRTFLLLYTGWLSQYACRRSLGFLSPHLHQSLGFSKIQIGAFSSFFNLSYGLFKFIFAVAADNFTASKMIAFGLALTGCVFVSLGLSSHFALFAVLSILSGVTQGLVIAPAPIVAEGWWSAAQKGSQWSRLSTATNVGSFLLSGVGAPVVYYGGWRALLVLVGCFSWCCACATFAWLRDKPRVEGTLTPRPRPVPAISAIFRSLYENVLANRSLWLLSCALFCVNIVRGGVTDWYPLYLVESHQYSASLAASAIMWLELGGVAGSFCVGLLSDRVFQGRRGAPNIVFLLGLLSVVLLDYLLAAASYDQYLLRCAIAFLLGFLVYGPQVLIGLMASEVASSGAGGSASGFVGVFASVGGALSGAPLSLVLDRWHWPGYHRALLCCVALAALFMLPFLRTDRPRLGKQRR
jgi:OPA family sugar phosphate sensor protein UhpC-like MFS transporter